MLMTRDADGQAWQSVMWFSVDDDHIIFNSMPTSRKHRHILANPAVKCLIFDPDNMYRYLSLLGKVTEIVPEGAREHNRWLAAEKYGWDDGTFGEERVMYRMRIERAWGVE